MENASKALIIAGAVLIAILILMIGVYSVAQFGKTADSYNSQLSITEIHKYNSNFEVFIERKDITAQEIMTVINIAQQKEQGTKVYADGVEATAWDEQKKNEFLNNNILIYEPDGKVKKSYSCISIDYDSEGKVSKITFKKNPES